jgi:hypothetical protein
VASFGTFRWSPVRPHNRYRDRVGGHSHISRDNAFVDRNRHSPARGQIERAHFGPDPRHGPSRTQLVSPVRLSACRPYNRNCDRRHKHLLPHRLGVSTGQSIQPDKTPLLLTDSRVTACRQDIRPDRENTESLVTYRAIRACCWDKMIQPVRIGVISTCPAALKIRAACRQENRYSR